MADDCNTIEQCGIEAVLTIDQIDFKQLICASPTYADLPAEMVLGEYPLGGTET